MVLRIKTTKSCDILIFFSQWTLSLSSVSSPASFSSPCKWSPDISGIDFPQVSFLSPSFSPFPQESKSPGPFLGGIREEGWDNSKEEVWVLLKHDSFSPHLKLGDLFLALSLFLCLSVRLALSITNKDIPSHILHTFQKLSLYMTLGYTLSFYAASVILRNNISDVTFFESSTQTFLHTSYYLLVSCKHTWA